MKGFDKLNSFVTNKIVAYISIIGFIVMIIIYLLNTIGTNDMLSEAFDHGYNTAKSLCTEGRLFPAEIDRENEYTPVR